MDREPPLLVAEPEPEEGLPIELRLLGCLSRLLLEVQLLGLQFLFECGNMGIHGWFSAMLEVEQVKNTSPVVPNLSF
jgi:hypothetical protein